MAAASFGVAFAATGAGEPARHLDALRRAASACEAAGVELLLVDGRSRPERVVSALEPFSILAALAAETSALSLGALVAADERAPSILAKATSTLDVCSEGRAVLVLASPRLPAAATPQKGLLAECAAVARAMFEERAPTFEGSHVTVHAAWNEPRAFASPPPVAVALAVPTPEEAGRLVAEWSQPPDFVLVEATEETELSPFLGAGWGAFSGVPVLRLAAFASQADDTRRGGFDGVVVRFDDPASATSDVLSRLGESTSGGRVGRT